MSEEYICINHEHSACPDCVLEFQKTEAENKALSEKLADSEKEANKWIASALTWERTYRAQVEEFKALEKELATAKQSLAERDARIKEITNKIHFLFDAIKVQAENGGISTLSYWIGEELLKMIAHEALGPSTDAFVGEKGSTPSGESQREGKE